MQINLLSKMHMNNTLFIIIVFLISACSPQLGSEYYQEFFSNRQEQLIHLVDGDRAPLTSADLKHISHYPYKDAYRVKAKFSKIEKGEVFDMATYSGKTKEFVKIGRLDFKLKNEPHHIYVYQNVKFATHPIYGKYYFIPFKDLTSGEETYGGGRYMDMDISHFESSTVLLDFNQAYNPWCAYSDGYNCPIPPAENELNAAILAGEELFKKDKSH